MSFFSKGRNILQMNKNTPTAAVLLIGNELLSGRTEDLNLNYIARRLNDVGVHLNECRMVRDDETQIIETLNTLRDMYTYIFTTGGIGPTHDDITTHCVAKAFKVEIERNHTVAEALRIRSNGRATEETYKMADFPMGAHLIPNPESAAPGYYIGNVYVLAGIPKIMQVMLEGVLPLLEHGTPVLSKSVDVMTGESQISAPLAAVQAQFPQVELGSYPFKLSNTHGTSLVVRGTDREKVEQAFAGIHTFLAEMGAEIRD